MNYLDTIAWWSLSGTCFSLGSGRLYSRNAINGSASLPTSTVQYLTSKFELIRVKLRLFGRSEVPTLPISDTGYLLDLWGEASTVMSLFQVLEIQAEPQSSITSSSTFASL